ncbi:hypothetical protein B0H12DRAFT_1083354 [Mycena haematopus]|nr:hypothetical protein B0H12DRAFT_1083354 [Mycena haematopus]
MSRAWDTDAAVTTSHNITLVGSPRRLSHIVFSGVGVEPGRPIQKAINKKNSFVPAATTPPTHVNQRPPRHRHPATLHVSAANTNLGVYHITPYARPTVMSGKETRAASKHLQQRRKVAQAPPPNAVRCIPGLPNDIPLPEDDPLYKAALSGAAWLDTSDLGRWKKAPPFEEDDDTSDPYSEAYLRFNKNLAAVLHGDRMRAQNECDAQRRVDFHGAGWKSAMDPLRKEVAQLLKDMEWCCKF